MARRHAIELYRNGEAVDFPGDDGEMVTTVALRMNGESSITIDLDPTDLSLAVPGGDWEAYLVHWTHGGARTPTRLMAGALRRGAELGVRYEPPDEEGKGGGVIPVRRAIIYDRFRSFRNEAPGEQIRHTNSNSEAELRFIASQSGLANVLPSLAPVVVDEIIYGRDTGFWGPFEPYVAAYAPLWSLDPDSSVLQLIDPTELSGDVPTSTFALERKHYNPATFTVNYEERATQAKILYTDFEGGDGVSPTPVDVKRSERHRTEADGSKTTVWRDTGYLYEDPDTPDTPTREILVGEGQTRVSKDGEPLESSESRRLYRRDYTEHFRTTTTVSARCALPGLGTEFRQTSETIESREYVDDPDVPRRRLLDRVLRITTGLYVYTYVAGVPEADLRKTGTPATAATRSNTVDGSSQGSQRWKYGQLSTWVEHYDRMPGAKQYVRWGAETDDLRDVVIDTWNEPEFGDNAIDPSGRVKVEYYPKTGGGGKRAIVVDATKIGLVNGRHIAARRVARQEPVVRVNLELTRPNYEQLRLGWYVPLASDALGGLAGVYLITGVVFRSGPPHGGRDNVSQTLELYRAW